MFVDYSQLQPIAVLDQLTGLWLKTQVTPLFGPQVLFSQTFPKSGMTQGGKLYVPQTQGQPITEKEYSSLPFLPTPAVAHLRNHDEDLDDYLKRRQDYVDGKVKGMPGASLGVAVRLTAEGIDWKEPTLLPTPTARDYKDGQADHERDGVVQTDTVARAIFNSGEVLNTERATDWGKFAPAIRRWQAVIDREAPAPTKPDGKDGQHRLSAEFTEWMMGLPAGWVTDPVLGLTRNEMLKLCGNGVVPQQAALALTRLLTGINLNKEEQK